jgi:hypothetical protein
LLRNRRFLSNLAEAVEKAPVPSIILNHGASITLSTLSDHVVPIRIIDGHSILEVGVVETEHTILWQCVMRPVD